MSRVGKPLDISKISLKGSDSWTSQDNWQKQQLVKYLTDIGRFNQLQTTKQKLVQVVDKNEKLCLTQLRNYFNIQTHDVLVFFFTKKASLPKFVQGELVVEQEPDVIDALTYSYPVLSSIVPMLNLEFRDQLIRYLNNDITIYFNEKNIRESDQVYQCALVRYIYDNRIIGDPEKILEKLTIQEKQLIEDEAISYQRQIINIIRPPFGYQNTQFIDAYYEQQSNAIQEYN